jgi:hypothetical protein
MELKTKLIKFRIDTDTDAMGIIEDECLLAFSPDSTGVFELGDDVEKFSGLSLKDAKAYNETPTDAYIYGLQNIMNGGKDLFFWNNGNRLKGAVDKNGMWPALFEQLSHEGSHLARKLMVRAVAKKLNVSTDNEDWIKYDYGSGEYMWPTMGDHDDNKNPMIVVSEEQFVTLVGIVVQQLTPHFLEMAKDYLPELKNVNINEGITMNKGTLNINEGIMYNVDNKIALHKNPYRYGSTKFFEYYNDLRALKLENVSKDLDMFLSSDIGKVGVYEGKDVLLDFPMLVEAEYQGKKVELSKPMRNNSGGGKFKVYVKDPKSGNIRMIKFGADSGGGKLAVKLKDPKAKAAFKARHNCEQTKDKTTASYWSCRLPRYAKSLGLSGGGQWW